jgi:hypothetical protein
MVAKAAAKFEVLAVRGFECASEGIDLIAVPAF